MKICRVDANQPEITKALRKIGAAVLPIHTLGNGAPDLLVSYGGRTLMLELKDGLKPPSARRLTPDEVVFHSMWPGELHIVCSAEEAINIVGGYLK